MNKDIWTLAIRNLKADKTNVAKIVFGIGCVFMLIYCFVGVVSFFINYKQSFENNYGNSCYYYKEIEMGQELLAVLDSVDSVKSFQQECGATESSYMIDIGINGQNDSLCAGDLEVHINDEIYEANYYYLPQREYYQNLINSNSEVYLGYYSKDSNFFPQMFYSEECNYVGSFPVNEGEIMVDDYFLKVYGINNEPEKLIGSTISLYKQGELKEIICEKYRISGIISVKELIKREEEQYHDNHLEHIYLNVKKDDIYRFVVVYGSNRFYFKNYTELVENYKYSSELISMQFDLPVGEDMEYYITAKGAEICILIWIMNNIGKLLLFFVIVVVFVILFSLLYIISFYFKRNIKYMDMLSCIGMNQEDKNKLRYSEMFIILICAVLVGLYLSSLFFVFFTYLTGNLLSYSFSVDILTMVVTTIVSFLLVWLYKLLVVKMG